MARRVVAEFDAVTGPFLQKMSVIDASINRLERGAVTRLSSVERGVNSIVATAGRLSNVSNIIAAGFGANVAARFLDDAKLIRNALREAGDTSEETFNRVFQSSVRALSGFRDTAQGVQRFQKALRDTQGIEDSIRQVETLNKLLALAGKTTQERASTFIQFSQALQAGYLGGEELRAVRENAPIELIQAIAREAGGTIEDLKDLGAAGELTRDVMVRALKSLEEEADKRFKSIQVLITDAAQVFRSGATVAVEQFDAGLGLSRTTVEGLKALGNALGENAEAFRLFGQVAQVAIATLATAYAGRRISGAISSVTGLGTALRAAALAAENDRAAAIRATQAAQARLASAQALTASLQAQGKTEAALSKARNAEIAATNRLRNARAAEAVATQAAAAAQNRLLLSSRALAGTMGVLRGAFAFLGGVPGIILTAVSAFYLLRSNAESTADALERFANRDTTGIDLVIDRAVQLRKEYARLKKELGDGADAESLLRATEQDYERTRASAAEKLEEELAAYKTQLGLLEANVDEESRLRERLAALREARAGAQEYIDRLPTGESGGPNQGSIAQAVDAQIAELDKTINAVQTSIAQVRDDTDSFNRNLDDLEGSIARLNEQASAGIDSPIEPSIIDAIVRARSAIEAMTPEAEKQKEVISELEDTYTQLANSSAVTDAFLNEFRRTINAMKADIAAAANETDGLTNAAGRLNEALRNISSVNLGLQAKIGTLRAQLDAIRSGADEATVRSLPSAREAMDDAIAGGADVGAAAAVYERRLELKREELRLEKELSKELSDRFSSSGGSGGGRAQENELLKEAVDLIEQMMTAEEKRAIEIKDAIALRQQLIEAYGAEAEIVDRVTVAIERMKKGTEDAKTEIDDLFESMSDKIADAIEDWQGFGNLVRSILADIVRQNGVDFFTALLTPGRQSGGGLGTTWGNYLTGDAQVPSINSAKVSAASVAPAAQSTVIMNNDFTGADPSTQAALEAKIDQLRAEFPGLWIETAREVKSARIPI